MTPLQREALQMCLEYIETDAHERRHVRWKINEALAQPQPEPAAWMCHPYGDDEVEYGPHNQCENCMPLYTSPPAQRKPLTDEQTAKAWAVADGEHNASASVKRRITRAIEATHGIKENT